VPFPVDELKKNEVDPGRFHCFFFRDLFAPYRFSFFFSTPSICLLFSMGLFESLQDVLAPGLPLFRRLLLPSRDILLSNIIIVVIPLWVSFSPPYYSSINGRQTPSTPHRYDPCLRVNFSPSCSFWRRRLFVWVVSPSPREWHRLVITLDGSFFFPL